MMTPKKAEQIRRDLEGKDSPGALHHFDKDGRQIPLWRWVVLFENMPYCRVAETHLWPGIRISTVWLGLDHGWGDRRLIFETMVFTPYEGWDDTDRYGSLAEARWGHACFCAKWELRRWGMLLHIFLLGPVARILLAPLRLLRSILPR